MWLGYAFLHYFCHACVNYIDEHLMSRGAVPKHTSIHTKTGGLILTSTLLTFLGAYVLYGVYGNITLAAPFLWYAVVSGIPMVITWISYFYLLTLYPVYQVIPLFQMTSVWLLLLELLRGSSVTPVALTGIIFLIFGAYFLDAGSFKLSIPTKLLLWMIPTTITYSVTNFLVKLASESGKSHAVSFWQMMAIGAIGVMLFIIVKGYRAGLLIRLHTGGKSFLGFSLLNESLSQVGFFFGNLSIAAAPLATYFTASSGIQGILLLGIFLLFPQRHTKKITPIQILSMGLIAVGVVLIER